MNKIAPYIITGKDLDYLSDMFNWNYNAFKCTYNVIDKIEDENIKQLMIESKELFKDSCYAVLNIIGGNNE